MKHFEIWDWADFVRGVEGDTPLAVMETHLAAPCPKCQRIVNVLSAVVVAAQAEAEYEPPLHAIRNAQAIYSLYQPDGATFPRLIARLVHDTSLAPAPVGLRSQTHASRHALYEADNYYLDLQLERQPDSRMVNLTGQLADRNKPATSTAGLPIFLMERSRLVVSARSNRFGEFNLQYPPARNLRLQVPLPLARKRLEVSLSRLDEGLSRVDRQRSLASRRAKPRRR
jgi:hypothetical protein